MSPSRAAVVEVHDLPMDGVPALDITARLEILESGAGAVTLPLSLGPAGRFLRRVLGMSTVRRVEVDHLSLPILRMVNGRRTVGEIIEAAMNRWQLSFFEAKALVLDVLDRMGTEDVVVLLPRNGNPRRQTPAE